MRRGSGYRTRTERDTSGGSFRRCNPALTPVLSAAARAWVPGEIRAEGGAGRKPVALSR